MSWQSPGVVAELIVASHEWKNVRYDLQMIKAGQCNESKAAAQWRAAALLCKVTTGWNEAVQHWRALVTELRAELVCDRPICDRVVGSIASRCPALTRLDLSSSVVTVASVQQLSLHCPRLRWLSLRASCHSSLSDDIILALVGCTALEPSI